MSPSPRGVLKNSSSLSELTNCGISPLFLPATGPAGEPPVCFRFMRSIMVVTSSGVPSTSTQTPSGIVIFALAIVILLLISRIHPNLFAARYHASSSQGLPPDQPGHRGPDVLKSVVPTALRQTLPNIGQRSLLFKKAVLNQA